MPFSDLMVILTAVLCVLAVATWWVVRPGTSTRNSEAPQGQEATLLFEDGIFSHASLAANAHFGLEPGIDEWEDFQTTVAETFPEFPDRPGSGSEGDVTLQPAHDAAGSKARVSWRDGVARVVITEPKATAQDNTLNAETREELAALRRMNMHLANPVWQTDETDKIVWFNPSYAAIFNDINGADPEPEQLLFDLGPEKLEEHEGKRVVLEDQSGTKRGWYEVVRSNHDGASVYSATCIDAVVRAEETQRNFVQTLAKTFAHLSIGLAIFDRNQQLVLFNPALMDLTSLKAEFLSARPTVLSFFDGLRENRRMPEPKNYRNWRETISELFAAANDGRYQETWSLESGQTYRVTGRPHPDGATAFLIEDISAEVTLTRNFRAELELGQSLLDTLDDGLAVFSASGIQTFSNKTYCTLWNLDPDASFADVTINDAIKAWKSTTQHNKRWQEIEEFVLSYGDKEAWDMVAELKDGRSIRCQMVPITSGATLIRFRIAGQLADKRAALAT